MRRFVKDTKYNEVILTVGNKMVSIILHVKKCAKSLLLCCLGIS